MPRIHKAKHVYTDEEVIEIIEKSGFFDVIELWNKRASKIISTSPDKLILKNIW